LDEGVGASAGFGTVGGGEDATKLWKKRNIQEEATSQIMELSHSITENNELIKSSVDAAMGQLLHTPRALPTLSTYNSIDRNSSGNYDLLKAKEGKVKTERKLLVINAQIDHHKYVISSDCFDEEEKKESKQELKALMLLLSAIYQES
jgi:hypothetical protein